MNENIAKRFPNQRHQLFSDDRESKDCWMTVGDCAGGWNITHEKNVVIGASWKLLPFIDQNESTWHRVNCGYQGARLLIMFTEYVNAISMLNDTNHFLILLQDIKDAPCIKTHSIKSTTLFTNLRWIIYPVPRHEGQKPYPILRNVYVYKISPLPLQLPSLPSFGNRAIVRIQHNNTDTWNFEVYLLSSNGWWRETELGSN